MGKNAISASFGMYATLLERFPTRRSRVPATVEDMGGGYARKCPVPENNCPNHAA